MPDKHLHSIEAKLDQLLLICTRLDRENKELKERESNWSHERTRLIEKNELARNRVEAMIGRLKNMETEA
mgnify:FL=1